MKFALSMAAIAAVSGLSIERDPLLTWAPTPPKGDHPVDYFVPHFGEDHDIKSTKKHIRDAEARFGHILDTSDPPADPPRNYFVPNFGVDSDIKASLKNLDDQEKKLGKWSYPESEWY